MGGKRCGWPSKLSEGIWMVVREREEERMVMAMGEGSSEEMWMVVTGGGEFWKR